MVAVGVKTLLKSGIVLDLYFFKNNRSAFVSMLIWPYLTLGLILGMGAMFGSAESFRQNVGLPVNPLTYFVASTVAMMVSMDVMWGVGGSVLEHRWVGTLPYVILSPNRASVTLVFTYVPRYLLTAAIQLAEFAPLVLAVEGFSNGALKLGVMALAATVGMLPLLGFAALFASFLLSIKEESNILSFLNPLILLFSGAFYPAYLLPRWAQLISAVLPSTYTIELARLAALIGSPELRRVTLLIGALVAMTALYNSASGLVIQAGERRALREGAI